MIYNKYSIGYNSFIAEKMSYGRFKFLYTNFTMFSKSDKKNGFIVKQPKILKEFIRVSNLHRMPKENISIDEAMCAFKRRVLNRVYAPEKPCKFGMKMYMCCDSTDGYILNMAICGEKTSLKTTVKDLIEPYQGKNRICHMDNFYNSIELAHLLLEKKYIQMEH